MSAFNIANLRDLVGGWSCLTFAIGVAGAAVSFFALRVGRGMSAPHKDPGKVSAALAAAMLVVALFIGTAGVAKGMGYSGPTPEQVPIRLFDRYLAALIALAFAVVFTFDTFWLSRSRSRPQ
jgi:hypothetical protein